MAKNISAEQTIKYSKLCKSTISAFRNCAQSNLINDEVISPTGLAILVSIYHKPYNDTISSIALGINVSKGLCSREVEKLRSDGYLTAVTDENDRRIVRLRVNENSLQLIERELDGLRSFTEEITQGVSDEEFNTFMAICEKIQSNVDKLDNIDND
ncbi:MAG: MarR family winged helix-turn-helix transcriptional regulator [Ruminococcus sp.]|nr:MarR family winged helix-turn-helix transcriptional regulator [Ruminococcus sp.]